MPLLPNAKKALRVSKRKTAVNARVKSIVKTMIDKVKKDPTAQNVSEAYSAVDTSVKNKLMHKNKAARLKAQLSKLAKPEKLKKVKKVAPVKKATKAAKKKSTTVKAPAKKTAPKKVAAKKTAKK
jgi:ribosomal protein S20